MGKPTVGMGGRVLSPAEEQEFDAFAQRCRALGWEENDDRTGSWGKMEGGRFKELARIDVVDLNKRGWRSKTHIHITGRRGHFDPATKLPGE